MNMRDLFRYKLNKKGDTFAEVLRELDRNVRAIRQDVAAIREQQDTPDLPK